MRQTATVLGSFSIPIIPSQIKSVGDSYGATELEADLTLTVTVERRLGARLTVMRFGGNPGDVTSSQKLSGLKLPVSAQTGLLTRFGLIFLLMGKNSLHPTSRKIVGI